MLRHWHVDESFRGSTYLLAAVSPRTADSAALRARVRSLPSGRTVRVHMTNEAPHERRRIIRTVVEFPVDAVVVMSKRGPGDRMRTTRDRCLRALIERLLAEGADEITLESCDEDAADRRVVREALSDRGRRDVSYSHDSPSSDCLLWLPDVLAWAHGAGGQWRRQIAPLIRAVVTAARSPAYSPSGELPGPLPGATAPGSQSFSRSARPVNRMTGR